MFGGLGDWGYLQGEANGAEGSGRRSSPGVVGSFDPGGVGTFTAWEVGSISFLC